MQGALSVIGHDATTPPDVNVRTGQTNLKLALSIEILFAEALPTAVARTIAAASVVATRCIRMSLPSIASHHR